MHCSIIICLFVCYYSVEGRKAPALDDICSRGAYSFCPNSGRQAAPGPSGNTNGNANSRDLPQPNRSPNDLSTPPSLPTVGDYCDKYQDHYKYYCQSNNAADTRASSFCPTYLNYCAGGGSPPNTAADPAVQSSSLELPPSKIQKICVDYQPIANLYCFRPQIPKEYNIKKTCDMYLKTCVPTSSDQLQQQNKTMEQVLRENIKPCEKFHNDYIGFCVQNPTPYNDNIAEFCRNYKSTCIPSKLPLDGTPSEQAPPETPSSPSSPQQPPRTQGQLPPPGLVGDLGAIGGNPFNGAGSPVSSLPLGNPDLATNPLGSLAGAPSLSANPSSAVVANAPVESGGAAGNPGGLASNPLTVGSQTSVGNLAGVSKGTAVNPFGQVATGTSVQGGPIGVQSGQAVDFSGIPGLSRIGSLLGRRRRKRRVLRMIGQSRTRCCFTGMI